FPMRAINNGIGSLFGNHREGCYSVQHVTIHYFWWEDFMTLYSRQWLAVLLMLTLGATATADDKVDITEWEVPWENSRPRDPWVGGKDTIWFVGQRSDYVARLNPQTGEFKRYDLEAGAGPHTVISD